MTPEQRAALEAELVKLKTKARARRLMSGYAKNVEAIEARMAEIEGLLAQ